MSTATVKAKTSKSTSAVGKKKASPHSEKYVLNCIPSRNTEKDWNDGHALAAGVIRPLTIPTSKDLRASWWPVGDQGSTGSCVGWATADSLLRWHFVKTHKIVDSETMSTRFIWMAAKESDEFSSYPSTFIDSDGTSLKAALDIARKFGSVTSNVLPFDTGKLYKGDAQTFYALAARLKIASYFNLGIKAQSWRIWLATQGPILTRLDVDETWDNATSTKGKLATYKPDTRRGGHAVSIVGYTPSNFIVRNSWGTGWGDKGFAYASDEYALSAFTEAYGISV